MGKIDEEFEFNVMYILARDYHLIIYPFTVLYFILHCTRYL
jgi:hypothetical protein